MKLTQSGPEQDAAGEVISKLVAESDDLDELKRIGLGIADNMKAYDALWLWGPSRHRHSLAVKEEEEERCYLSIRP